MHEQILIINPCSFNLNKINLVNSDDSRSQKLNIADDKFGKPSKKLKKDNSAKVVNLSLNIKIPIRNIYLINFT